METDTPATSPTPDPVSMRGLGPGRPLDPPTRTFFETRTGRDLAGVRVHAGPAAAGAARALDARAFTVGSHVVFGEGEYSPATPTGRRLLAHELAHVLHHAPDDRGRAPAVLRRERDGESSDDEPKATDFRRVTMHFDGRELVVSGDGEEVMRFNGQSGRPIPLRPEHAEQCGADPRTDTYMNDERFVGIRDYGPIPEGRYRISPPRLLRLSFPEAVRVTLAGIVGPERVDVGGRNIHSGDWGAGRAALVPAGRVREGPCGNANARSGFFLHGGVLAGSSGCIDVGLGFGRIADFLEGYRRPVTVTVEYTEPPRDVGFFTGLGGAVAYGGFEFTHGPSAGLGFEVGGGRARALGSVGYDAVLEWAGGAISAGARLDVPVSDREAFVRAALGGGANSRLLGALYGRLQAAYVLPLGGAGSPGMSVGGGLRYDFGPVQAEALYDLLRPLSEEERVHQTLLRLGFRF